MTTTITITRSTRLGYGCTSRPEEVTENGRRFTRIAAPEQRWTGTPRTIREARAERLRSVGVTGGGSVAHREALFVDGRRVISEYPWDSIALLVDGISDAETLTVE